jgi:VCBS repeat-containing protein
VAVTLGQDYVSSLGTLKVTSDGSYQFTIADSPAVRELSLNEISKLSFNYTIGNNSGSANGTLTINVTGVNDAPVGQGDIAEVDLSTSTLTATGNVLTNDSDIDKGDSKNATAGSFTGRYGTLTLTADGGYTYTLDPVLAKTVSAAAPGTDIFTYKLTDANGASAEATLTINIKGVNDAPIAQADAAQVDERSGTLTATGNVLANDSDIDTGDRLSVTPGGFQGSYGTLTLAADGSYTYTLDPIRAQQLTAATNAKDVFNYTVIDSSGATATSALTVNITANAKPPIVNADTAYVVEDVISRVEGNVLANDQAGVGATSFNVTAASVNGQPLPASTIGASPGNGLRVDLVGQYGTLTMQRNGQFTYVLNDGDPTKADDGSAALQALTFGQTATDRFLFRVTDNRGEAVETSLNITINATQGLPSGTLNKFGAPVTATVFQNGVAGDDVLVSSSGYAVISGYGGNDTLRGPQLTSPTPDTVDRSGYGNVMLYGGAGNDALIGGAVGTATALYKGNRADFTIDTAARTIRDNNIADGDEGQDSYQDIRYIQFADARVDLGAETNRPPVRGTALVNQTAAIGTPFSYTIPASAFVDPDAGTTLSYSATLVGGSPLPGFITFNASTRSFTITSIPASEIGRSFDIRVIARDGANPRDGQISSPFTLTISGAAAPDITGTAGNDTITGTTAAENIFGLGGNDIIEGRGGGDRIDGGDGLDTSDYTTSGAAVTINLGAGTATGGAANGDILISIERLIGSAFADSLTGDDTNNNLSGGAGADILTGAGGNDTLGGGSDNDTLSGGLGDDILNGNPGDDILNGDDGNDILSGNDGVDTLNGGAGNDILAGGDGADTLDGGTGFDIIDYTASPTAVTIVYTVASGVTSIAGSGGHAQGDIYASGIESFLGSAFDDVLTGASGDEDFSGGAGNDILTGNGGNDTMRGGDGNDRLLGGSGADTIFGNDGNDLISGDAGADTLYGGNDNDIIIGQDNSDTIIGGNGNDTLIRGDQDGGAGTDLLVALDNANVTLTGGADADIFIIDTRLNTGATGFIYNLDVSDFALGQDKIDLSDLRDSGGNVLNLQDIIDHSSSAGANTTIDLSTFLSASGIAVGGDVVLNGISNVSSLSAADFVFTSGVDWYAQLPSDFNIL